MKELCSSRIKPTKSGVWALILQTSWFTLGAAGLEVIRFFSARPPGACPMLTEGNQFDCMFYDWNPHLLSRI